MDSKFEYRFPLSFERQSNLHFWPLFDERLWSSIQKKGAQQKRYEIFNQPLIRFFRRRQYVDILTSKKQSKEPENRDTLQKIFSD